MRIMGVAKPNRLWMIPRTQKNLQTKDVNIAKKKDFMANILIVEDEKNMQDIIAEYMKKACIPALLRTTV